MQVEKRDGRGRRVLWTGDDVAEGLAVWHAARRRMRRGALRLLQGDAVVREAWAAERRRPSQPELAQPRVHA